MLLLAVGFQSLLCWIMVCKNVPNAWKLGRILRFNPCYVGLWSVRQAVGSDLEYPLRFNPCYVGLWSVRTSACTYNFIDPGFNPCYVGLWSVSPRFCVFSLVASVGFNPCYVGLWSVRHRQIPGYRPRLGFQSLLCWIMVCKGQRVGVCRLTIPVSILVMLDYGL